MRLKGFSLVVVLLVLLLPSAFAIFSFLSFPPPPPPIFRLSDVNGQDLNVQDILARNIDANSITLNYIVARNEIDFNILHDVNATGFVESRAGFVSDSFCSFSDRENCIDASGPVWNFVNFGINVDGDIDGFDITANNDLDVLNDLDVADDADIHGSLVVDETVTATGGFLGSEITITGDSNFVNIGVSEAVFATNLHAGNTVFTAFLFDNFGLGGWDMTGDPYALGTVGLQVTNGDFVVSSGDSNFVTVGMGDMFMNDLLAVDRIQCDNCTASGDNSVALGDEAVASGVDSISMGRGTIADGIGSINLGIGNLGSTAVGGGSVILGFTQIGETTNANGLGNVIIGLNDGTMTTNGDGSVIIGFNEGGVITANNGGIVIGKTNRTTGTPHIIASGNGSFAGGYSSSGFGGNSFIEAVSNGSIARGFADEGSIFAVGEGAVAMGYSDNNLVAGNEASDKGAIALGYNVKSLGEASVALGKDIDCYNDNQVCVQDLNVLGDANIANLSISGITFANDGVQVSGDSNFSNIGVSENVYVDGDATFGEEITIKGKQRIATETSIINFGTGVKNAAILELAANAIISGVLRVSAAGNQFIVTVTNIGAEFVTNLDLTFRATNGDIMFFATGDSILFWADDMLFRGAAGVGTRATVDGNLSVTQDFNILGRAAFNDLKNFNENSVLVNDLNAVGDISADGNIFAQKIRGLAFDYTENVPFPQYSFDDANVGTLVDLTSTYVNGLGFADSNFTVIVAGWYKISGGTSFSTTAANHEIGMYAAKNNVAIDEGCHVHRKTGTGSDVGNMNWTPCAVQLSVGDKITMQLEDEKLPTTTVNMHDARIEIEWIAP